MECVHGKCFIEDQLGLVGKVNNLHVVNNLTSGRWPSQAEEALAPGRYTLL